METVLRDLGMAYNRVGTHLRVELHALGAFYGIAYFVAAEEALEPFDACGSPQAPRGRRWETVCGDDTFGFRPRKDQYLYLVGSPQLLGRPGQAALRAQVEDDRDYALKRFLTPEQARETLAGAFGRLEGSRRASPGRDLLELLEPQELQVPNPDEAAAATSVLDWGAVERMLAEPAPGQGSDPLLHDCFSKVLQRVLGRDYAVRRLASGERVLCAPGNPQGLPLRLASRGERVAVAFSLFLATAAAAEVRPGMRLAVHDVLGQLDNVRCLLALDLLREFAIATGAVIELRSAKSSTRQFALAKFDLLA